GSAPTRHKQSCSTAWASGYPSGCGSRHRSRKCSADFSAKCPETREVTPRTAEVRLAPHRHRFAQRPARRPPVDIEGVALDPVDLAAERDGGRRRETGADVGGQHAVVDAG